MATQVQKEAIKKKKEEIKALKKWYKQLSNEAYNHGVDVSPAFMESAKLAERIDREKEKLRIMKEDAGPWYSKPKTIAGLQSSTGKITKVGDTEYINVTLNEYLREIGQSDGLPKYFNKNQEYEVYLASWENGKRKELSNDEVTPENKDSIDWCVDKKGKRQDCYHYWEKENEKKSPVKNFLYDDRYDVKAVQVKDNISYLNDEYERVNVKKGDYLCFGYYKEDNCCMSEKDFFEQYQSESQYLDKMHRLLMDKLSKCPNLKNANKTAENDLKKAKVTEREL